MKLRYVSVALLLMPLAAGFAQTQTQTSVSATERTFEIGFDQRIRSENWNNIGDYRYSGDDEREQIRWRTKAWIATPSVKGISFFAGLTQETNEKMGKDPYFDEIFIDNAYLNFDRLRFKGLSLRVGRQNLAHGEGFILFDGTSGDGSRSTYFNGIDLSYKYKASNLEFIGISDPSMDRYAPRIHDQQKLLQSWDEKAVGVYYTDNNHGKNTIEGYWFYKAETGDRLSPSNAQHQPDRFLNTAGGRLSHPIGSQWLAVGEFAVQRGHQVDGKRIDAKGGYAYLKRTFDTKWKPSLQAGYVGLSGSDPSHPNTIGDWDPLFSRYPKWSEGYVYSQVPEKGVGYWTNTNLIQLEGLVKPSTRLKLRATYYRMGAYHPFPGPQAMFGTGLFRGQNFQGRADYAINRYMVAHVLYERILPGSFYTGNSPGYFLRFETSFLVKHLIPVGKSDTASARP